MKDRQNRPPPLALAPAPVQRQKKTRNPVIAVRGQTPKLPEGQSHSPPELGSNGHYEQEDPLGGGGVPVKAPPRIKAQTHPHSELQKGAGRRGSSADETFLFWLQLGTDITHVHICAVLVAALATFIYQVPDAAESETGSVAVAALAFLSTSTLLCLHSVFHASAVYRMTPPPSWSLLLRLAVAAGLTSVFVIWVARQPGPRVFIAEYRLWGMAPAAGSGLLSGGVLIVALADFARVALWRDAVMGGFDAIMMGRSGGRRRKGRGESSERRKGGAGGAGGSNQWEHLGSAEAGGGFGGRRPWNGLSQAEVEERDGQAESAWPLGSQRRG